MDPSHFPPVSPQFLISGLKIRGVGGMVIGVQTDKIEGGLIKTEHRHALIFPVGIKRFHRGRMQSHPPGNGALYLHRNIDQRQAVKEVPVAFSCFKPDTRLAAVDIKTFMISV